jgi:hypothetical protein
LGSLIGFRVPFSSATLNEIQNAIAYTGGDKASPLDKDEAVLFERYAMDDYENNRSCRSGQKQPTAGPNQL